MLTQEEAERMLATPKVIVESGQRLSSYVLDFAKGHDFRIWLSSSGNISLDKEFLLVIHTSEKMRVKVSLHTQENKTDMCIFRLDFNGATHKNPETVNAHVPERFKPFAGKRIGANHVHYHVEGYDTGVWALPVEVDAFPVKELTKDNFSKELKCVLDALSEVIHLESKIILTSRMMLDELD